jgi:uncharacterized damage-inducible protein DinB
MSGRKEIFVNFARHNEEADRAVLSILTRMPHEDREKNRKSYYGSLSGLFRHALGGTVFFLGLFRESVANNAGAVKALEPLARLKLFQEEKISEAQWKKAASACRTADRVYVDFVSSLSEEDLDAPVKVSWYGGKHPQVPLYFMLQQLAAHGIHHRGQISQILDSLKIDNDYSGINVTFIG